MDHPWLHPPTSVTSSTSNIAKPYINNALMKKFECAFIGRGIKYQYRVVGLGRTVWRLYNGWLCEIQIVRITFKKSVIKILNSFLLPKSIAMQSLIGSPNTILFRWPFFAKVRESLAQGTMNKNICILFYSLSTSWSPDFSGLKRRRYSSIVNILCIYMWIYKWCLFGKECSLNWTEG